MSIIDFIASFSELYERRMAPISTSFDLTAMELAILLFLANNPEYNTAKDIVEKRHLTKSHISISLRDLEERGFIRKEHRGGNNRTFHLVLLPPSDNVIREGQKAQTEFLSSVTAGFSAMDTESLQSYVDRMNENVLSSLQQLRKEGSSK